MKRLFDIDTACDARLFLVLIYLLTLTRQSLDCRWIVHQEKAVLPRDNLHL